MDVSEGVDITDVVESQEHTFQQQLSNIDAFTIE